MTAGPHRTAREILVTLGLLFVIVAVGVIDVLSGPLYGVSLFYLIPITIGAWTAGARAGAALSVAAAATWFVADILDHTPDLVPASVWNGFTRLVIFTSLALLLAILRARERHTAELEGFRGQVLELIDRQLPQQLDRVRQLTARSSGRDTRAQKDLTVAVDDLVWLTYSVVALSLVASGSGTAGSRVDAVVEECVRGAGARDRVVLGTLVPARAAIDARVLRFLLSGVVVAALRATDGYVRIAVRSDHARAGVHCEIDAATRPTSARSATDLLLAIATARSVIDRLGGNVSVRDEGTATIVDLELPTTPTARGPSS